MKPMFRILILFMLLLMNGLIAFTQCSMCTKTAQQLGEKPAQGLNSGILYLMLAPFAIIGIIAWRWVKQERRSSN